LIFLILIECAFIVYMTELEFDEMHKIIEEVRNLLYKVPEFSYVMALENITDNIPVTNMLDYWISIRNELFKEVKYQEQIEEELKERVAQARELFGKKRWWQEVYDRSQNIREKLCVYDYEDEDYDDDDLTSGSKEERQLQFWNMLFEEYEKAIIIRDVNIINKNIEICAK